MNGNQRTLPLHYRQDALLNEVIGNLAVAVDAAGVEAERRGYSHAMLIAREPEGAAEDVGRHTCSASCHMRASRGPDCLITGGEPVVKLAQQQSAAWEDEISN